MVVSSETDGNIWTAAKVDDIVSNLGVIESGCQPHASGTSPGLTVSVEEGTAWIQENRFSVDQQYKTLSTADGSNERIDLLVLGSEGTIDIIEGTPAASPVTPDITPGHIGVARISVPSSDTTITNDQMTDLRNMLGLMGGRLEFVHSGSGSDSSAGVVELDTTVSFIENLASIKDHYIAIIFWDKTGTAGSSAQLGIRFTSNGNNADALFDFGTTAGTGGGKWYMGEGATNNDITIFGVGSHANTSEVNNGNAAAGAEALTSAHTISLRGRAGDAGNTLEWRWILFRLKGDTV